MTLREMRRPWMTALVAALLLATAASAVAQHEGHQMPAGAAGTPEQVAACRQGSQAATVTLDAANARIEDARQSNDPAAMRSAIGDFQVALAQVKRQLADCVALSASAGSGMTGTPGMDHSKMTMPFGAPMMQPGSPAPLPGATERAHMEHSNMPGMPEAGSSEQNNVQTQGIAITFQTKPAQPVAGDDDFEVTLKDRTGKPIADAEVSLAFYMRPMPSMNMPAMRNTVKLTSAGNGIYRGSGTIGMAGNWDVIITATRKGQPLGTKKVKLTAK